MTTADVVRDDTQNDIRDDSTTTRATAVRDGPQSLLNVDLPKSVSRRHRRRGEKRTPRATRSRRKDEEFCVKQRATMTTRSRRKTRNGSTSGQRGHRLTKRQDHAVTTLKLCKVQTG